MKIKEYMIKEFHFDIKLENLTETIEQKLKITGSFLEDKTWLDIDVSILANNTKNKELFSADIKYRVKLEEEPKEINREETKKVIQEFYPTVSQFLTNFYQKELGIKNLIPPKF